MCKIGKPTPISTINFQRCSGSSDSLLGRSAGSCFEQERHTPTHPHLGFGGKHLGEGRKAGWMSHHFLSDQSKSASWSPNLLSRCFKCSARLQGHSNRMQEGLQWSPFLSFFYAWLPRMYHLCQLAAFLSSPLPSLAPFPALALASCHAHHCARAHLRRGHVEAGWALAPKGTGRGNTHRPTGQSFS